MKYNLPLIASDCPQGRQIEFFAEYFLPEYPFHHSRFGKVSITVTGKDSTPPEVGWVRIPGDNVIQARIYDGAAVQSVKARLILKADPTKSFEIELKDDGTSGDVAVADGVFSRKIDDKGFGIYRVVIEATDVFGSKGIKEVGDGYVLH